jgi:hypothetical protein
MRISHFLLNLICDKCKKNKTFRAKTILDAWVLTRKAGWKSYTKIIDNMDGDFCPKHDKED